MPDEDVELAFDGGSPRTRKAILFQLNDRLKMEPGVEHTRFEPGRITPTAVVAAIDPTAFLGEAYPTPVATLEVRWSPRSTGKDHFAIQWYETPDTEAVIDEEMPEDPTLPDGYTLSCGWHQDDHFDDLGPAHFQEDHPDGRVERYGLTFADATPRWILSRCLETLPGRLETFRDRLDAVPNRS